MGSNSITVSCVPMFIPQSNCQIYSILFTLETVLRELIIQELEKIEGPQWHKRRLPPDVREKYKQGLKIEMSIVWTQLVPHHPIYYTDFPDLRKTIEQNNNWDDIFKDFFRRKENLTAALSELEPIRNKIAHNRKASSQDLEIAIAACTKISQALGPELFTNLARRCTCQLQIPERINELKLEAEHCVALCMAFKPIEQLHAWTTTRNQWWFDDTYLDTTLTSISALFEMLEDYTVLPRIRGTGHKVEAWVHSHNIFAMLANAQTEFSTLLNIFRR